MLFDLPGSDEVECPTICEVIFRVLIPDQRFLRLLIMMFSQGQKRWCNAAVFSFHDSQ